MADPRVKTKPLLTCEVCEREFYPIGPPPEKNSFCSWDHYLIWRKSPGLSQAHRELLQKGLTQHRGGPGKSFCIDRDGYKVLYGSLIAGHPLSSGKKDEAIGEHRVVLYNKIGHGPHKCWWCGVEIEWKSSDIRRSIHSDHLDGDTLNNDPSNLVPSCQRCNRSGARLMQHKKEYE